MAKNKTFICKDCGAEFLRWSGKCDACGGWNTLEEAKEVQAAGRSSTVGNAVNTVQFSSSVKGSGRIDIENNEINRVLGGGIVLGSVILLGGEPGIGKSTIALQLCGELSKSISVLYISGEESADQVNMRFNRLGIKSGDLNFTSENNVDNVIATIRNTKPQFVLIDSIQTMYSQDISSVSGSIGQVRDSAVKLIDVAKSMNIPMIIIGHVTKEGSVAGPKTLEHLVDTVLYLEGDRYHSFRVLRGIKNRFGSTNEVGLFEMKQEGLVEVKDPSGLFLQERQAGANGSVVTSTLEGNRTFLIEVQGLTTRTVFGYPKRTASGYDVNRLQLLIAVLTKRANLKLGDRDVYLNIVGGFKIKEPAVDLAICLAVASSFLNKPIDAETIALGEVGLSGEIWSISQLDKRLKEAVKLGFKRALVSSIDIKFNNIEIIKVKNLKDAIENTF